MSRCTQAGLRRTWRIALLPALMAALWLFPSTAQAGTVTIVDGPDTPPVGGVYTDGFIQTQLVAAGLTITTTGVGSGANEIRVLPGAVITWTTDTTLTLDAGTRLIISGTIQHDGPATGAGGLRLLASEAATGAVILGTGEQIAGVAAGSRHGLTRVQAGNLVLTGGSGGTAPFAQLGYNAINQGVAYTVTGAISVTVSHNLTATGGATALAYAQIGHGGADTVPNVFPSGSFSGPITVDAGGDVTFQGGSDFRAYAQMGNGGIFAGGNQSGNHSLTAGGDVTFQAAGGNIAYAQMGNGGVGAIGNLSGSHRLTAGGDVTFQAAGANLAYAQMGNGGHSTNGNQSGSHSLTAGGDVTFQGGGAQAYTQMGNGGYGAFGNHSGDHRLAAGGDVTFQAGANGDSFAQLGNGGSFADGDHSGDHSLSAGGNVTFQAGSNIVAYAQMGNGGPYADGSLSGSLALTSTGSLTVSATISDDAYAMIGHGADVHTFLFGQGTGSRAGDIRVRVGETAVFSASQVGHLTISGTLSVTVGNTVIGVSQNDPSASGAGQLLVTGVTTTSFASAPTANGGELRFYLPREESQQIPTNAAFNGESFAVANTIPPAQLAGVALFGEGSYIPNYSFYMGGDPEEMLYLPALQR